MFLFAEIENFKIIEPLKIFVYIYIACGMPRLIINEMEYIISEFEFSVLRIRSFQIPKWPDWVQVSTN